MLDCRTASRGFSKFNITLILADKLKYKNSLLRNMDSLKKQILTLSDNSKIDNLPDKASKILKIDINKIKEIIEQLLKEGLISIIKLENQRAYSHTSKVKKKMLDETIHYKYGSRPMYTYS
jgi:hypothetical protein